MKILFIGDLNETGRSFQRYKALLGLGYEVHGLSHTPVFLDMVDRSTFLQKLFWKLKIPIDVTGVNNELLKKAVSEDFDIIWIEKGNTIKPSTLKYIREFRPDLKIASVSEDDMYAWHNRSLYYTLGLKYYDIVFTTKVYNLTELKELGAKRTELFLDSYDETLHRPIKLSTEDKKKYSCDVGFIGTFEEDRASKILYLAGHGIPVVVWGNGWARWKGKHPHLVIKGVPLYGEDYVKAINATKINLGFLRKANRDQVTSRSVEIPACGAFLLAERTKRHLEFFEEGKEAEFFDSNEEMLEKVKKYLANDGLRGKVAKAGRERCLRSGYGVRTQLKNILRKIEKI